MLKTYLIVALVAYLLGSIPFGYILVKLFLKQDIRRTGSGNIGATNVARSGKKGLAIATLLLDAAKGYLAVLIARGAVESRTSESVPYQSAVFRFMVVAALFAIVGHCFPVWLRFKGGKGVATGVGAFAAVSIPGVAAALGAFALVFSLSRFVSLGSIIGSLTFPVALLFFDAQAHVVQNMLVVFASSAVIVLKHHSNVRRLLNGTEPKFGTPRQALPADPIQVEKNA